MSNHNAISPTRNENYALWYQNVIKAADLAENSPVRGCMIIKPWGYAIWENIKRILDQQLQATGHQNVYFPLFVPLSFLQQEANHIAGFAKECAVVTHRRLTNDPAGKLTPTDPLEEPYIIRPTSETLIGEAFARWIQSYRDLPLLVNQWANVVRWEMRPRMFLRTSEFLWQEGHTAHSSASEAQAETLQILELYRKFLTDYLAMAVIVGIKPEHERFPGAVTTYCLEAMMQDKKALQAGTSHFLGQNFAHAMNIKFLNAHGKEEHVWTTSWGVSTRLIGGLIMTHSDDDGLVLPPKIAPLHIVILPILHQKHNQDQIMHYCLELEQQLQKITYNGHALKVKIDTRELPGGEKSWSWVKKGVPIRLAIGNNEVTASNVTVSLRNLLYHAKQTMPKINFLAEVGNMLNNMQEQLYTQAKIFQSSNTYHMSTKEDFYDFFASKTHGFVWANWNTDVQLAQKIKQDLKATIRCLPLQLEQNNGQCIFTGQKNSASALFAHAY